MAGLFDKERLFDAIQHSSEKVKKAVQDIDVDELSKKAKEGAKALGDRVKDIDIMEKLPGKDSDDSDSEGTMISPADYSVFKIIYYLMLSDRGVLTEEEEKYREIAAGSGYEEAVKLSVIEEECIAQIEKAVDEEDYFEVIREGIEQELRIFEEEEAVITPEALVWDLIIVANSDMDYSDTERKLIKMVSRRLNVEKAVFLEMENAMETLVAIEKEEDWIKTTDRSYAEIDSVVKELERRKEAVLESIKELISL